VNRLRIGWLNGVLALLVAWPIAASAHHSFAVYDFDQQIPFDGVVETLNFKNPHISMTLKRTLESGETEIVNFVEGAPANMAVRMGLHPDMIKPGTRITAIGSPRKDDPKAFFLRKVILEDGRELL
jgi:hypothetical protein